MFNPNDDPAMEEELEKEAEKKIQKQSQAVNPAPEPEQEQANEAELAELEKANFEEHEKWLKNLKEVVNAMKRKKDALSEVVQAMKVKKNGQPETENVRLLVLVLGGGMQGSYGAGQMCALQEMGYASAHINDQDTFLGISAGAGTCAFGLAGRKQTLLGTSYFYTICTTKEYLSFMRLHNVMDISVVARAFRTQPTKLDTEAIKNNPAQFYVQAFNEVNQIPEFINAKNPALDMIDAVTASMSVPVVYNKNVTINGTKYSDGAFDDPLPLSRAIEKFKPSHVLVLPNIPFNKIPLGEPSKFQKKLVEAIPHHGSLGFFRKVLMNRQALRKSLDEVAEKHNVKIGVAWPPDGDLGMFTQDGEKIRHAIKNSAKELFKLFEEPETNLKLFEENYPGEAAWQKKFRA